MKALLVALTLAVAVVGGAGVATLALERRLAALTPGGVEVARLHYDPLTGRLALAGIRALDAAGREVFRADHVIATVSPFRLLERPLTLTRARVFGPVLTLRAAAHLDLAGLAAGLGAAPAAATSLPVRIEDLVIAGGRLVIEDTSEGRAALVIRGLDVRLSRLTTAPAEGLDVAFAVETAIYGTTVHVTGQPRGSGYALRVRGRGLAAPALARDLGPGPLEGLERGRADVDIELVMVGGGRVLASGHARLTDAVLALPVAGRPRLGVAALAIVVDGLDLVSGVGRISRIDVLAPTLALPAPTAATTLAALVDPLRGQPGLLLRRVKVTDGTLVLLHGPGALRVNGLQLMADAPERRGDGAWLVTARARLDGGAEATLDGVASRDLRGLDAVARLQRVAVAPWRALFGASPMWDARLSFDGRLRVAAGPEETIVTLAGQVVLADVGGLAHDGFRAERIALDIGRHGGQPRVGVPLDLAFGTLEDAARTVGERVKPSTSPD